MAMAKSRGKEMSSHKKKKAIKQIAKKTNPKTISVRFKEEMTPYPRN